MFEFDDDDNTIMHQWKSHEEELSEYQKVWEQFHTTFLLRIPQFVMRKSDLRSSFLSSDSFLL